MRIVNAFKSIGRLTPDITSTVFLFKYAIDILEGLPPNISVNTRQLSVLYCFKISKFYAEGESTFPRDEEKALEWFERGAASSDATTKLYVAWRFWKGDDTIKPNPDKAVYWCEQCLPKDGGVDRKKDKTELAALKMLKDIMQGKPAPDSLKDILDTGPVM